MKRVHIKEKKATVLVVGSMVLLLGGLYLLFGRGGRTLSDSAVSQAKYDQALTQQKQFLEYMKQDPKQLEYAKRDVQQRLREQAVIEAYAKAQNIVVSQTEVLSNYQQELSRVKKSESQYLIQLRAMYGVSKEEHLQQVSFELLKQKVQQHLHKPLAQWLKEQLGEKK